VHADSGLSLTDHQGDHHVIPWSGIEAVLTVDDERAYVFGSNGCVVPVGKLFRGSEEVLRRVLEVVDDSRVFRADSATRKAILG